ncbi:MaoC family dehydratase [Saccharopolyspora pogona]|uniref:MaoC family dehydratase n=1 Tax=Saccharopolyspora pogona TaxID=333966 RepID=UPI001CC24F23|nr:MaoC family dehydratase [Saccharopolyspora pogona]
MPKHELTIEELAATVPRDLGTTDWCAIGQYRVDLFAEATEDRQWIHVDAAAAAAGPFGTTIAHGYLTLSLVPHLLSELIVITDQTRGTNYGLDRIRFTNAVPAGARIRLTAEVAEAQLYEGGSSIRYKVRVRVEVEDFEKPAMVGEVVYLASND